ncbi:MAG: GNAT family N-acetyltransferase, partial [Ruminococcaceae bacterium]|nr:GNAT family N-acetyltransferase [Oscillospiraceae bacterium]
MVVKKYDYLPSEAIDIRTKVFVFEQGFTDEIDDIDATALHFLAFCEGIAVGTCRAFKTNEGYILGRLAVLKQYRKKGVGSTLLK